jgi:hypothetical protein
LSSLRAQTLCATTTVSSVRWHNTKITGCTPYQRGPFSRLNGYHISTQFRPPTHFSLDEARTGAIRA